MRMQESLINIQSDSTMMLMAGIAIVVLLAIVLVVVISSMRIRGYKESYQNLLIELKEKSEYIKTLEKEAEASNVEHAKNKKELSLFDETKQKLNKINIDHKALKASFNENKNELDKSIGTLNALKKEHKILMDVHESLKEELNTSLEENSKIRTVNARLLTKLENEVAKALREQGKK